MFGAKLNKEVYKNEKAVLTNHVIQRLSQDDNAANV